MYNSSNLIVVVSPDSPLMFFDTWGEGPYSLQDVRRFCDGEERREWDFFVYSPMGRVSYHEYKRSAITTLTIPSL